MISAAVMEGARDGKTVAELMSEGRTILTRAATHQGHAASVRYDATHKTYTTRFPDCKTVLVPFVIERGGFITPIVALTANVMRDQVASYLEAGMDSVVAKPLEVSSLFEAMEAGLARNRRA